MLAAVASFGSIEAILSCRGRRKVAPIPCETPDAPGAIVKLLLAFPRECPSEGKVRMAARPNVAIAAPQTMNEVRMSMGGAAEYAMRIGGSGRGSGSRG